MTRADDAGPEIDDPSHEEVEVRSILANMAIYLMEHEFEQGIGIVDEAEERIAKIVAKLAARAAAECPKCMDRQEAEWGRQESQQPGGELRQRSDGPPWLPQLLEHPEKLSDTEINNIRDSWERLCSGVDNSHRAVLAKGMKLTPTGPPWLLELLDALGWQGTYSDAIAEVKRLADEEAERERSRRRVYGGHK